MGKIYVYTCFLQKRGYNYLESKSLILSFIKENEPLKVEKYKKRDIGFHALYTSETKFYYYDDIWIYDISDITEKMYRNMYMRVLKYFSDNPYHIFEGEVDDFFKEDKKRIETTKLELQKALYTRTIIKNIIKKRDEDLEKRFIIGFDIMKNLNLQTYINNIEQEGALSKGIREIITDILNISNSEKVKNDVNAILDEYKRIIQNRLVNDIQLSLTQSDDYIMLIMYQRLCNYYYNLRELCKVEKRNDGIIQEIEGYQKELRIN